jgi:hypothetical protein
MPMDPLVVESFKALFSDVVSHDRFEQWKEDYQQIAAVFDDYLFGEIFWRKAMGRPKTAKVSEGFLIQSWRNTKILAPKPSGLGTIWIKIPHSPIWWDGKDDAEYWRVPYLISAIPFGHRKDLVFGDFDEATFVVPGFSDVPWEVPGGEFGIGHLGMRVFEPREAVFVKEKGSAHFSFEVVSRILVGIK